VRPSVVGVVADDMTDQRVGSHRDMTGRSLLRCSLNLDSPPGWSLGWHNGRQLNLALRYDGRVVTYVVNGQVWGRSLYDSTPVRVHLE